MAQNPILHPEQGQDELYLLNVRVNSSGVDNGRTSWRTNRYGFIIKNEKLGDVCPWFIKRSEVEEAIAAEKIADKPWSPEKIRTYQEMLDIGGVVL